jgi:hypothetical protein
MATINQLKKIYNDTEKFEALTSTELAEFSGFLKAEEQIGREAVKRLFHSVEYALQSASYGIFAEFSQDLADASAEFALVSALNRQYEIRYNKVYHETYGVYPSQAVGVGA